MLATPGEKVPELHNEHGTLWNFIRILLFCWTIYQHCSL